MLNENEIHRIKTLAHEDVATLIRKGKSYGDSWRRRGGIGAFMVMARKMDRIENISSQSGYNIFEAIQNNVGNIIDDIKDLRAYLLLIEEFATRDQSKLEDTHIDYQNPYRTLSEDLDDELSMNSL